MLVMTATWARRQGECQARDIPRGAFVNLGIGLPTKVSNHLAPEDGVFLHTENGMLGMGPEARGEQIDPDQLFP